MTELSAEALPAVELSAVELSIGHSGADVVLTVGGERVNLALCQRLTLEVLPNGLPVLTLTYAAPQLSARLTRTELRVHTQAEAAADSAKPPPETLPQNAPVAAAWCFASHLPAANPPPAGVPAESFVPALLLERRR